MQKRFLAFFLLVIFFVETSSNVPCQPPNFFKCKNDRCIHVIFKCDKEDDCGDNSDELDCGAPLPSFADVCKKNEWQCLDRFHCIPEEEYCDGKADCIDGSDELDGCHSNKTCTAFRCKNGRCINENWVCDGMDDCKDNSDELDCNTRTIEPRNCNNTIGKYLCTNQRCTSLANACDGKNDCGDDSDENPAECAKAKTACNTTHTCAKQCTATPKGPQCSCPNGFLLTKNGTCEDKNECLEYGICAQICRNTIGSYYCRCETGYELQEDGRNCKSDAASAGEAVMIFASKTTIQGYYLVSKVKYPIAENLQHVVGVSLDDSFVYWSDIQLGDEAIFRSNEDGSNREVIVTAGLGCPEDIAVDWIAGNIYFTDSGYKHIGICSKSGDYCTVIIKDDTEKPRGIALLPSQGKMYWSDWGDKPHISVADMDGAHREFFIKENIAWPNGLTIDYPSMRLYWVDAKLKVIESILLDGQDRRTVLHDVAKHPYSIAIFENRLYWSDWSTNSIHSCNKFTGKDFDTLFQKNETMYGIHIYHSTLKLKYVNPCVTKPCSQLCLLGANRNYTCACTLDKVLNEDKHTCSDSVKRKHIAIAAGNTIIDYYHELLGRPRMSASIKSDHISALTYDSLADSIIAADETSKSIFRFNPHSGIVNHIIPIINEIVESIAFDHFGNNLYKSNTIQKKIEVHSLTTGEKAEFSFTENPYDLVVVPEEGLMFVVFRANNDYHIDKAQMNGLGSRTHLVEHGLIGPRVSLAYDPSTKRVFWADEGTGRIESIDTLGQNRNLFRTGIISPVNLAVIDEEVFWTSRKSVRLNWANKKQHLPGNKGLNLNVQKDLEIIYLQTISGVFTNQTHPCRQNNGDCSHICLVTDMSKRLCACPSGFVINADQKTCRQKTTCLDDEMRCMKNDKCIKKIQKCNGVNDCPDGEDEEDCLVGSSKCQPDEFACHNGECIKKVNRCDSVFNCKDHSDEENCENKTCTDDEYRCRDGNCISKYFVCNGISDCPDFSDEENCGGHACDDNSFKCGTGLCIPRNWECDGQVDCNDGSDEHDSCKPSACAEKMFSCKNGRCVDVLLRCNGLDDCDDNSDETDCPDNNKYEALICRKDQYRCRGSMICINQELRCDGKVDCPGQDDEHGCGRCRAATQFSCGNGNCVALEWVCDKTDDCGDNSDEQHCDTAHKMHTLGPHADPALPKANCSEGFFACKTGSSCFPLDKACDGFEYCFDGSDEGGQCGEACETNPCDNICHKTPDGPVCSCRDGYKLNADGKSCEDIDECQRNLCPQICTNVPGSFVCSCYEGYALRLNHMSCKATGPVMKLITATTDDIRVMRPTATSNSVTIVHREPGIEITGLDVNAHENTVYWSNELLGIINKMNIDTKQRTTATNGVGRPEILAVDWITDNVYFFDNKESPIIKACNVDANKCSKILHIDGHNIKVAAIAVEPLTEYLFWSQVMWKIYEKPTSEILRADLMGADQKIIVHENLGIVSGLTIDPHKSLLYWADNYQTNIECVDFNGNNRQTIIQDLLMKPIGLSFYEDTIYYKTEASGVLRKRLLYGDMSHSLIPVGNNNLNRLFVLSQISRQPTGSNPCKERGCEHLCVVRKGKATCICANGFPASLSNNTSCPQENEDDVSLEDERLTLHEESEEGGRRNRMQGRAKMPPSVQRALQPSSSVPQRRQGTGAFTGLAVALVSLALMVTVYFYIKKKKPGFFKRRDLSIHFQNPSFARRNNNNTSTTSSSSILMPGEHEYSNPITEMSNTKLSKSESGSKKRIELGSEMSDNEADDTSTTSYHSRLIR